MTQTPREQPETAIDEAEFRRALSRFASGVTVVTGRDRQGRARAITVSAFTSVSLAPPLILYCLGKSAYHFEAFAGAEAFAVNLLSLEQEALSNRFAREADDDLADVTLGTLVTGSPVLADCLATLDCETAAVHEAGDHLIMVGRVLALSVPADDQDGSEPLVYFRSGYRRLRP